MREMLSVEDSLPISFNQVHVKSHKYDGVPDITKISLPNLINKCCDASVTTAYSNSLNPPLTSPILPSTRIYIKIGSLTYIDNVKRKLCFASKNSSLKQYIMKKAKWQAQEFNMIHWDYSQQSFYHCTTRQKKAFMKVTHKKWATNNFKSKMSNRNDHRCQRCQHLHKNWNHIFQC